MEELRSQSRLNFLLFTNENFDYHHQNLQNTLDLLEFQFATVMIREKENLTFLYLHDKAKSKH